MELRDFIVTPLLLLMIYTGGYVIRPMVSDSITRKYLFPALSLKLFGAISLGFLYQFYYGSGDTFMYHTYGSRVIWEAFWNSPEIGLKLIFANGKYEPETFEYASNIYFYHDLNSYPVIRLASIFDLFTFSSYSGTACLFAVLSFIGSWQLYLTFYEQYPQLHRPLAIAVFFIPSVFFWGSGILKDTITLACLSIATYQIYRLFIKREFSFSGLLQLAIVLYVTYTIRIFMLMAYLPAVIMWIGFNRVSRISTVLRILLIPFFTSLIFLSSYFAVMKITEDDQRYSVSNIAETARITAYDIRYWTGRDAGSGYSLGELDGEFGTLLRLAPQAINVSLFRPYLWEIRNPLMLLLSIESLTLLIFTLYVISKRRTSVFVSIFKPNISFALTFSLIFAFAVGVSTFNFGTLARYKMPLIPFYLIALILILHDEKSERKFEELDLVE